MRRLELGVIEEAPPDALACWGANAIIRNGRWEVPHEQQEIVGTLEAREELARSMNDGAVRDAEAMERRLVRDRIYPIGARVVVIERRDLVVLVVIGRASDNIVRVTAYTRAPKRVAARISPRRSRGR